MQEMNKNEQLPSFSEPIDAIVLAGTHNDPSRWIEGRNKAFLEVGGRSLLQHVIDALLGAQSIADIFVVGPAEELRAASAGAAPQVHLIEQQGDMGTNCWAGIDASDALRGGDRDPMRPVVIISCDLPIISATSIDDFVTRCADDDRASVNPYALMVGLVDEAGLAPFDTTGMARPFVEFAFARARLANIYVARPRQLSNQAFLQTGFGFRKAIHWRNVLGLALSVLSQDGGWQAAWMTLRLQATLLAARRGGPMYRFLRRWNTRDRVEVRTSRVLGGPVRLIVSPFGGLSLDVDNEEDFKILADRYNEWMAIHDAAKSEYTLGRG